MLALSSDTAALCAWIGAAPSRRSGTTDSFTAAEQASGAGRMAEVSEPGGGGRFADIVIDWQRRAGRHGLPWQSSRDPYRVWVSEIMLQQTQVTTVLGYYDRFLERFPDVHALAAAPLDAVLGLWSGLGYYSRARHLHACARAIVERHAGRFPADPVALEALPGIGRSTAAAIVAFAHGVPAAILDANVKRVLARVFAIDGYPGIPAVTRQLWAVAQRELPEAGAGRIESYTQGLMDLGATVCLPVRPHCAECPVAGRCEARRTDRVAELPGARAARAVGERTAELVLVCTADAVLLERRAPRGLWGGLWSLPEFAPPRAAVPQPAVAGPSAAAVAEWTAARIGCAVGPVRPHGEFRHVFTHFRLRARVWRTDVVRTRGPAPDGHEWLARSDLAGAPLPRPVRTLLEALPEDLQSGSPSDTSTRSSTSRVG